MVILPQTKNVPKLRFEEFNDTWELNEFSNIVGIVREKYTTKKSENLRDIELESIESETGKLLKVFESSEQKSVKTRFRKGDILFGKLRPYLKKFLIAPFDGVCSSEIWVFRSKKLNNKYIHYLLQTYKFNRVVNIQSGSKMPRAEWSYVSGSVFSFPEINEQEKITEFLIVVDEKVEILAKKIELFKKYKKGIVQKIFSQEIRFKDENGKSFPGWEEKKLGDMFEITSSKRVYESEWKSEGVPFYRTREILSLINNEAIKEPIFISEELYQKYISKYGKINLGDMLVTGVGTIGEIYLVRDSHKFYFKDGNVIWLKGNSQYSSKFVFYSFQTKLVRKQIEDNASITTVGTYTIVGAKKTKILLPTKEEQEKIAEFLTVLDEKIEFEEGKLSEAKKFKKFLLQNMFV